jgi:predicted outer membrane protein
MLKHITQSLALSAVMAMSAVAQNPATRPAQPGQPRPAGAVTQPGQPGAQAGNLDQGIAACIALGNQEEIALAQYASTRAKNEKVKEFAQTMQREHTAALQKLRQVAPQLANWNLELQAGANTRPASGQTGVQQAGAPQQFGNQPNGVQQAASTQPAGAGGHDAQMVALQRTIAQQCLALTQRELDEAGADFDHCYIGQQVGAHVAMLAKLQGSEQFAGPELRGFIQEATKTVEQHLQHAKQIAKELKSEAPGNASAQR